MGGSDGLLGGRRLFMRYIFILNGIWEQDKINILVGLALFYNLSVTEM
jgi:hypothetical protein